jgi:hypothetical protein
MAERDATGLTPEQKKAAQARLDAVWLKSARTCPICGSNQWQIADHLVTPVILQDNSLTLGGTSYPQVMVISPKCGYTMYFNAILLGIVPRDPEVPQQKSDLPDG